MKNKHILITGGSLGIGRATAQRLAAQGAYLHLTGRRESLLTKIREELGERVFIYPGDIGEKHHRAALIQSVARRSDGKLDGLVVNAAKYGFCSLNELDLEEMERYFQVNAIGVFHLAKLAFPLLEKGSGKSVVFVSSTLSLRPIAGTGAYAATKAALNSLVQSLALEWAPRKIRVNAVLPGVVDTPIHEPRAPGDPDRAEKMAQLAPMHPLGRVGRPEDVAASISFLLSPDTAWVTGSLLNVDGGVSLV